jgi:phosphatidylserine/phosphatidylglycerophosphate/cardiolipin synthase-like enzyme
MDQKNPQSIKIYEDNDRFFDTFWKHIDNAKDLICIATYDMDHKNIACITIQKLRNACKRGVKVFLIIDDLNFYANKE